MLHKLTAFALAALLTAPLVATATPITYQIKFTVVTGSVHTVIFTDLDRPATPVHTEDAAGKVYFGLFAVDDEVLLTDGINKSGNVDFFYVQMEDNIWGYNLAANNSFIGFLGPTPDNPSCMFCRFSPSPGFDVVNGTITNLRGGVFGLGDGPFVDFSLFGANVFSARGGYLRPDRPGTSFSFVGGDDFFTGSMEIFRVPEPGALPLFGFGLLVLTLVIRRARA